MSTIDRAYMDPEERREAAEEYRESLIYERMNEIIADPALLDDAVGDFGTEYSFTGLYQSLSLMAQCKSIADFDTHGRVLNHHLRTIALWQAEKDVPPISALLYPQAGEGEN